MEDKIVNRVVEAYKQRSKVGIDKYGTTLARNDLNSLDWLKHLQEELMDATLYLERIKYDDPDVEKCIISGVNLTEVDTYNQNTGCPYANFVEGFRSRHKIPVADLRIFVQTLKSRL